MLFNKIIKLLLTIFLLLIIVSIFAYIVFYLYLNIKPADNFINSAYRKHFISRPILRKLFRLKQSGDARYDLATDKDYKRLIIVVYVQEDESLQPNTLDKVVKEMKKVIQKPAGITTEKRIITRVPKTAVDDDDLKELTKTYPVPWPSFNNISIIQIFVLKKYIPVPTFAGLVKDDHNIFLFKDSIRNIANDQEGEENYEISTILHEFAHLLGAGHVSDDDCLLSEKVENLERGFRSSAIRINYCQLDLQEIDRAIFPNL